ncbi:hypothetical protein NE236_03255 [Actinoallomurus purpureus]|uniref:hypothetical protein n=1 Tax=Actinoallomurus purpureus TaxID=478114 RepID=UPI002093C941|nr:hypothetical protein [Actinoallomurus purpureus]MCO6003988.1 hypothetical protein [Actinoallomurus purpureus]
MTTQEEKNDAIARFVESGKQKPRDTRSGPSSNPSSTSRSSRSASGGSALGGVAAKLLDVAGDLLP